MQSDCADFRSSDLSYPDEDARIQSNLFLSFPLLSFPTRPFRFHFPSFKERKYFDSGDYALSKAGKAPQQDVGTAIPNPETIPHASTVSSPGTGSVPAPSNGGGGGGGGPTNMQGGNGVTSPINMPPRSAPQVSAFPTANGNAGSPSKEGSSLGREEVVGAGDQEMAD